MPAFQDAAWPLALLLLRIAAVGVLYLFLYSAFNALRAELRGWSPVSQPEAEPSTVASPSRVPSVALPPPVELDPWEPLPKTARRTPPPSLVRQAIPAAAVSAVLILGTAGIVSAVRDRNGNISTAEPGTTVEAPAETPAAGQVTVGLAATEDSNVRVTVDGVVEFDGVLKARERQNWEGTERIQVWTDKGKTLQLAVNGRDLGAYSPAMGHPDWNRIDFGFWPGWAQ